MRKNDVEKTKILSSIAELEKFNAKLEKDIEAYQNGSVSEEDKTKLAELKGQIKSIEEQKSKLNEDQIQFLQDRQTKIVKQYLPIMNKLSIPICHLWISLNFNIDENQLRNQQSRCTDLALLFTWRAQIAENGITDLQRLESHRKDRLQSDLQMKNGFDRMTWRIARMIRFFYCRTRKVQCKTRKRY